MGTSMGGVPHDVVVNNDEGQYSSWQAHKRLPAAFAVRVRLCILTAAVVAVALLPTGAATAADPTAGTGSGRWQRLVTTGDRPTQRSAPVAVGLDHGLYVFGGADDEFATGAVAFFNDLRRLDTRRNKWTLLTPAGTPPPARAFAASAADPLSHRIFVFGGSTFNVPGTVFQPFDDLWSYSAVTNRWTRLAATNPGPSARSGSTMWVIGDKLYLFGGIDATFATLNELWRYDLRRATWTLLTPTGALPPPRHVAQAGNAERSGRLTIYGGESIGETGFVTLNDTWQFELALGRWQEVTPAAGNIDPGRNYGAAAVIGSGLYVQGGDLQGSEGGCGAPFPQNPTEQLWRFDLNLHTWRRLTPAGDPLARLKRHAAATVDGRMYVVAGWDFQCAAGTGPGQIWNLDTYTFSP